MSPREAASCCRPVDDLLDPTLFKALCDPTRVKILGCLVKCSRACSVGEIAECCSVDMSAVSRHLRALAAAEVVAQTKSGRVVSYSVRYEHVCGLLRSLADAIDECRPQQARELVRRSTCAGGCRGAC